jgi:hypothetical protein
MNCDPIDDLEDMTAGLWARTGLAAIVRLERSAQDDGSPLVEVSAGLLDIVITERGQESERIAGLSAADAARWFLFTMSQKHAQTEGLVSRCVPKRALSLSTGSSDDGYSRWNRMAPTIETIGRISPSLADWAFLEYERVLTHAPLLDFEVQNA